MEEWVTKGLEAPPLKRCVGWRKVDAFEARYASFDNRMVSYRVGPYRVTEQQDGVVRRADGRLFNVFTRVEVSGGLWWHLVEGSSWLTGMSGFGHPGHISSTFFFIPQHAIPNFRYRGAGVHSAH